MDLNQVIKKPIITEKSHRLAGENNEYTFQVALSATKGMVKKAVAEFFDMPIRVRITKTAGKTKRVGKARKFKKMAPVKKAIVQLATGKKIDLFEFEEKKKK